MRFQRTSDLEIVRSILTHPSVWPHVTDDYSGAPEEYQPNGDERIWYVLAFEGDSVAGLFTFLPRSVVLYEAHIALLKKRETRGVEIAAKALEWMFDHSGARRIIAEIPASNRLACKLAGRVMTQYGINPGSFQKFGVMQDLVLFGLDRPVFPVRKGAI